MKRLDVKEKRQKRRTHSETCVKCCLKKMIRANEEGKQRLVDNLEKRVESYSMHMTLASVNLLGLIKEFFKGIRSPDLPEFSFPINIFDQTVLRNVILDPISIEHPDVQHYFHDKPQQLPTFSRHNGDGNTFTFGMIHMMTSLKNSLFVNIGKRIKKFLRQQQNLGMYNEKTRIWMLYAINGWKQPNAYEPSDDIKASVAFQRRILGLQVGEQITERWSKSNLFAILKYNVFINRFYEDNKLPCFNLTPLFAIKRHFITIDTDVFYGVMKDIGAIDCNKATFRTMAIEHYLSMFNIASKEGKHCEFTRTIQTDGVSLIVHYLRPRIAKDKQIDGFQINPSHRLVAIDPGRENIFCGVEMVGGNTKSYVLTRNQYYVEAGMIRAKQNTHQWHKGIRCNLDAMSMVSSKGVNPNRHATYVSKYLEHMNAIWQENWKPRWARQRLRLYGGKKRVFARFFKGIEDADRSRGVTVAYGSAGFAPGGKGEVTVPVGRAFKECCMYFPTKVIDEFRTTAVHYFTDTMLQKVQKRRCKGTKTTVRGLLWCSSTNRNNKFVNRDLNAALNILRCALGNRPEIMTRESKIKVDKTVGKHIR